MSTKLIILNKVVLELIDPIIIVMTMLEMTFAAPGGDEEQSHHLEHHVSIDVATVNLPVVAAAPDGEEPPKVSAHHCRVT